jgi:AbiV family abortive infection protein
MKRNYHSDLDFVEAGFRACWQNASDLLLSAQLLLESKLMGTALALSVLTMEKIGSQIADEIFGSSSEGESDEQENKATLK